MESDQSAERRPARLPDLRKAAQRLAAETQASILSISETLQKLQTAQKESEAAAGMLTSLPHHGNHEIMVPLGKAAFFPGRLVNTDRCLVEVGESSVQNLMGVLSCFAWVPLHTKQHVAPEQLHLSCLQVRICMSAGALKRHWPSCSGDAWCSARKKPSWRRSSR